jgi:uncharacterized protein (DUF58 family)
VVATRPYVPGDRLAWIDWQASARLSVAKDNDIFLVRQFLAETAPRVVIVADRRPSMGLYPADLPWLSKPEVEREAILAILAAAHAVRAYVGYLEFSRKPGKEASEAHWIAPHRTGGERVLHGFGHDFDAPGESLELGIDYLLGLHSDVPAGTFVFVLSDFLEPGPPRLWSRVRARGWDLVPVIIQDPVWEQSFPAINGVLVPIADPESGQVASLRVTRREARARQQRNAARLSDLIASFRRLQFDPVLLDSAAPTGIDAEFFRWAGRRRKLLPGRA